MAGLVCVCRAGGRAYVFRSAGLYECLAKEYELAHLGDVKCEPEREEEAFHA